MPILPESAKKILSRLHQNTSTASPTTQTLPSFNSTNSEVTLFDALPEEEKRAAIAKLHRLASEQPGSTNATTPTSSSSRRRFFNWKIFAMVFLGLGFVAFAIVASVALAVDNDKDPNLVAKLRMANTNLDRMKLLPDDSDWFFDFTKSDKYTFAPGGVVNANAASFPATVGQGMTMVSQISITRNTIPNMKLTSHKGHAQLGSMLHAATTHPSSCHQLRRRRHWYNSNLHDR